MADQTAPQEDRDGETGLVRREIAAFPRPMRDGLCRRFSEGRDAGFGAGELLHQRDTFAAFGGAAERLVDVRYAALLFAAYRANLPIR